MRGKLAASLVFSFLLVSCRSSAPFEEPRREAPSESTSVRRGPPSDGPTIAWREAAGVRYLEVVPAGVDPDAMLPMVVFIHGLGDQPRAEYVLRAGDPPRARFILPRGLAPYGPGFSWFAYRVGIADAELEPGIVAAADELALAFVAIAADRPTRGRAIVCGFSQGGMLSFALALRHPQLVQVAHPIAGYLPRALWPARPGARIAPIRAAHGTADDIVPFAPTQSMVQALSQRGFDVTLEAFRGVRHAQSAAMLRMMGDVIDEGIRAIERR